MSQLAGSIKSKLSAASCHSSNIASELSAEVAENFRAWFERNFVNARAGRIGHVSYTRGGELDDHRNDPLWYTFAYERAIIDHTEPLQPDELAFLLGNPLIMLQLALGVTDLRGLRCLRRGLTKSINNLQAKSYRSRYYSRDNARRRLLAAERRRITRRSTNNPCPTPDAFREAFAHRADSIDARIYFGGLVHDLECYVDNCLRIDASGEILGRNGGVKEWIAKNVPELYCRYKTIMRYKALAKRVRQAAGIVDPMPTDIVLPLGDHSEALSPKSRSGEATAGDVKDGTAMCDKNYYAIKSHHSVRVNVRLRDVARKRVVKALRGCRNTLKDLFDRLE